MVDELNPKHGALLSIPFAKTNLTTGESNTDLVLAGGGTLAVMPKAGSVVGIAIRSTGALTAGTITAKAHLAGTEFTDASAPAPVISSDDQESYAVARPRALKFTAGQNIGVSVTTTTTLDPTNTADVDALLLVQLDND